MKMGMGKAFGYEKEVIRGKDSVGRLSVDAVLYAAVSKLFR